MVVDMSEEYSVEKTFDQACKAVGDSCKERYHNCETRIRQSPVPAVLTAAGVGYFLSLLPLARISLAIGRLAYALLKPALLVIGVLKIVESLQKKAAEAEQVSRLEREREPLIDSPTGPPQG